MREDYARLLEIQREIEAAMSTTVRINHEQVAEIVVADLLSKYNGTRKRKDSEWSEAFRKVLRFYLDEDEFELLTSTNHAEGDDDRCRG